jgi:hypothetical protein
MAAIHRSINRPADKMFADLCAEITTGKIISAQMVLPHPKTVLRALLVPFRLANRLTGFSRVVAKACSHQRLFNTSPSENANLHSRAEPVPKSASFLT